jgi:hypothetical protein
MNFDMPKVVLSIDWENKQPSNGKLLGFSFSNPANPLAVWHFKGHTENSGIYVIANKFGEIVEQIQGGPGKLNERYYAIIDWTPESTAVTSFIRVRKEGFNTELYVDQFSHNTSVDVLAAARAAVAEFLESDLGKEIAASINYDFNWGDAIQEIPTEIWQKHGLRKQPCGSVEVNQDEVLCTEPEEKEDEPMKTL